MFDNFEASISNLLIVTDVQLRAERLINALAPDKYAITTILSLENPIQLQESPEPDLAIVWFPFTSPEVLSEFEQLISNIKSIGVEKKLPVLLIIDQQGKDWVEPAFKLGVTDILTRPIHPLVLRQRIKMLISSNRTERAMEKYQAALMELSLEEEKMRLIADFTYDWEYWIGQEGNILYNSPACERITGKSADSFIQHPNLLSDLVHPDDLQKVKDHYLEEKTSNSSLSIEFRLQIAGRGDIWIEHACQPVYGDDKRPLGRRVSNRESTARKLTEQALIRSERLAVMGRLLASLAHEINNPLQAISSSVELISGYQLSDQENQQYLLAIKDEINRLILTSRKILDFSRPAKTGLEKTDIHQVLSHTLKISKKKIEHARINIQTNIPQSLPEVLASPDELGQVILNLIINAVESMPGGGNINITVQRMESTIEISISDSGKGILADQLISIFDPFYSTKEDGTGLGLAVCKKIIEKFNGRIIAESQPHQGSVFKITLPILVEQNISI
jgi:PAS domain S-box-containing protein